MEFIARMQSDYGLSDRSAALLASQLETIRLPRRTVVVAEAEPLSHTYFVERGSVRNYVWREDRYIVVCFAFEGDAATPPEGGACTTSRYTVETMEESVLLRIPTATLEELFARDIELANWGRRMAGRTLTELEKYFIDYFWMEKGAQYARLLREHPRLLQRISLKDLAAYLSITPQTLSRIRAEIR